MNSSCSSSRTFLSKPPGFSITLAAVPFGEKPAAISPRRVSQVRGSAVGGAEEGVHHGSQSLAYKGHVVGSGTKCPTFVSHLPSISGGYKIIHTATVAEGYTIVARTTGFHCDFGSE